jgi:hypothetical protein
MKELLLDSRVIFIIEKDEFINGAYFIRLSRNMEILSQLHLVPLWTNSTHFKEGDYYQKTFISHPKRQGYGTSLIKTLLENVRELIPECKNIFSSSWVVSNNIDPTDSISVDAADFWKKMISMGKAISDDEKARFKYNLID